MASKVANGNVKGGRFIALDTVNIGRAGLCTAGGKPFGISHLGTRLAPQFNDFFLAVAGEEFGIHTETDAPLIPGGPVLLQLSGTVTTGDSLKSDTNGTGITTSNTGDWVGAIAEEPGVSGDIINVRLVSPAQY